MNWLSGFYGWRIFSTISHFMSSFEFQMPKGPSGIKVIGVGGGGGNAVNRMYLSDMAGVEFALCNTDVQALEASSVPTKIRLGADQTEGLGAGANPEMGRAAALESRDQIREYLMAENTRMVFVVAGMGGGTGTGAGPIIAGLAKEMGILTVGLVSKPFRFEGKKRGSQAMEGIQEMEKNTDSLIAINADNLTEIFGENVTMKKAFEQLDGAMEDVVRAIAEIVTREGYINVDFDDVQTILKGSGQALVGTAAYNGKDRAIRAAEDAVSSPLLDNMDINGAGGVLVNISASADSLRLDETTTIIEYIQEVAGDQADIIFGTVYREEMKDTLSVTVIATDIPIPVFDVGGGSVDVLLNTLMEDFSDESLGSATTEGQPLSIYFSLSEYTEEEIAEYISLLSDLYYELSGDRLVIKGEEVLDFNPELTPLLV